ncbi:50S ribosomal protein L10 [sediment metagenome]|uniref:50S ribosomal protein L10 n=1 Tax=sediment metagenome TaxID=749907 RepID=D9PNL9_9ZZZZ
MATQKKIQTVQEMTDKVAKAKSIIFAEYRGAKHKQLEEFRKSLKKVDAELMITKNRLMAKAMGEKDKVAGDILNGETATVFSYTDEVSGAKELFKFFKVTNLGRAKGGMLGNRFMTEKDVTSLSQIPSKEILLGRLVGQLIAPVSGLHHALRWNINKLVWALSSIKDKKA